MKQTPIILIDTREQLPYEFSGFTVERRGIGAGDYSLLGHENGGVTVERKSREDAYNCVGAERERFERCLERLARYRRSAIVIESNLRDFSHPPARTVISSQQAVGSFISWSCKYGIPVFWCDNRAYAERVTIRFLLAYLKHVARDPG